MKSLCSGRSISLPRKSSPWGASHRCQEVRRGAHPAWCRTAPREARSNRSQIIVFTVGLTIAGVRLFIQSRHSELPGSLDPPYLPFTGYDLDYSSSISVDLLVDTLTDTGRLRKVFDSNESWSLLTDESSFFIIMNPADLGSRQPVWVAEVAKSFERATVHCGEMLVEYHDGEIRVSSPVCYPLDQILLMHHLSGRSGVIVHGAGISINSKGYVFAGRSGAGKSTITGILNSAGCSDILSDDRVIVRDIEDTVRVFGTPWPGEGGYASNSNVPLSGIFLLTKGEQNSITEINRRNAVERLLPVLSIPWYDKESLSGILTFCDLLLAKIPVYDLIFRPDAGIVGIFREFVERQGATGAQERTTA